MYLIVPSILEVWSTPRNSEMPKLAIMVYKNMKAVSVWQSIWGKEGPYLFSVTGQLTIHVNRFSYSFRGRGKMTIWHPLIIPKYIWCFFFFLFVTRVISKTITVNLWTGRKQEKHLIWIPFIIYTCIYKCTEMENICVNSSQLCADDDY